MMALFRIERLAPAVGEKDRTIPVTKNRVAIKRNKKRIGFFKFFLSKSGQGLESLGKP